MKIARRATPRRATPRRAAACRAAACLATRAAASLARAVIVFVAAALGPAGPIHAQGASGEEGCPPVSAGPPCESSHSATNAGDGGLPDASIGNPVHPATGHKYQDDVDSPALPGPLGLEIRRHYNSRYASLVGPLGRGWSLSYETRLYPPAHPGGLVQIIQGDGRRRSFASPQARDWRQVGEHGAEATCTAGTDGLGRLTATAWGWRWVWPQQHELRFDKAGLLRSAGPVGADDEDRLRFDHDDRGRLTRVTDPAGRRMQLEYDEQDRLVRIRHPLGDWVYGHDAQGHLVRATAPDGLERRYRYEDTGLRGHLTGIDAAMPDQPPVTIGRWRYDAEGRAVRFTRGDGSRVDIDYDVARDITEADRKAGFTGATAALADPADGTTRVTRIRDGRGATTTYASRIIAGQWRLQHVVGPGCAECGPTNLRFAYDAHGRLTARWPIGRPGHAFVHDPQGRVVAVHPLPWPDLDPPDMRALHALPTARPLAGRPLAGRPLAGRPLAVRPLPIQPILRIHYPDDFTTLPSRLERPSQVTDGWVQTDIDRDDRGRPVRIAKRGFSPVPATDRHGTDGLERIERTTRFRTAAIGPRSRVVAVDGPSENGPTASPDDSDIARQDFDPVTGLWRHEALPDGLVRRIIERDAGGRDTIVETEDGPRRVRAHIRRDPRGRILEQRLEAWTVDAAGREIAGSRVRSQLTRHRDARGAVVREIDSAGRTRRIDHDAAGRPIDHVDATGHRASLLRDAEGRIVRLALHRPDASAPHRAAYFQRDLDGRVVGAVWPDGRWQQTFLHPARDGTRIDAALTIDHEGRMTWTGEAGGVAAAATAGLSNRPGREADGFQRWRNDFGQIVLERSRDHGARSFRYDAAGRLLEATDGAGVTLRFVHDHAGRQTAVFAGETTLARFHYEGTRRVATREPEIETESVHDALGRVVRTTTRLRALPGRAWSQTVDLDPSSGLTTGARLVDGQQVLIDRDNAAQGASIRSIRLRNAWWTAVADHVAAWLPATWANPLSAMLPSRPVIDGLKVDPFDGPVGWRHGNGVLASRQHDRAGRLQRLTASPGTGKPVLDLAFRHRAGPRIQQLVDRTARVGDLEFGYDTVGRLRTVHRVTGDLRVDVPLPRSSARTAPMAPMAATLPAPSAGPGRPDTTLTRDAGGRLIEDGRHRYRYNPLGQLAAIDRRSDDAPVARYQHDIRHQRIQRRLHTADGEDTTFYLWQGGQVVAEIDRHGKIRRQILRLTSAHGDIPVAVLDDAPDGSTRMLAVHTDQRAAPVAMTDDRQRIVWRADLTPYGLATAIESIGGTTLDLRLPGQISDPGTGLADNHHRSYDPATGNYLQPDPLGYPDGPDPYRYAGGDPINRIDPQGLYAADVHYYMTFFLAVTSGYSLEDARTIATATQYVDDNPVTRPLDDRNLGTTIDSARHNQSQLVHGHFTLSEADPGAKGFGETLPQYRNSGIAIDDSPQLSRLLQASRNEKLQPIGSLVFLGYYLHALEDTASHRDIDDLPINALSEFGDCHYGLGHGLQGQEPDKTYDSGWIQVGVDDDGQPLMKQWKREARTFTMEQMVYDRLRAQDPKGGRMTEFSKIEDVLRRFNETDELGTNSPEKIKILIGALHDFGYGQVKLSTIDYSRADAFGYDPERGLDDLERALIGRDGARISERDFEGVCLPGGTLCKPY